jgi:hypothetical protein
MKKQRMVLPLAALALVVSAGTGFVAVANADTIATTTTSTNVANTGNHQPPAAMGTVTAISGNSITLKDKKNGTTYTVDASVAAITKHTKPATEGTAPTSTTITASGIALGDTLRVDGTLSGTTIAATKIDDGDFRGGRGGMHGGKPGVHGTVSSISGNTMVVAGSDGKSYTVNASGAAVEKMQTISISGIQVGDSVGIGGTVTGTTVTATHVMDGVPGKQPY